MRVKGFISLPRSSDKCRLRVVFLYRNPDICAPEQVSPRPGWAVLPEAAAAGVQALAEQAAVLVRLWGRYTEVVPVPRVAVPAGPAAVGVPEAEVQVVAAGGGFQWVWLPEFHEVEDMQKA